MLSTVQMMLIFNSAGRFWVKDSNVIWAVESKWSYNTNLMQLENTQLVAEIIKSFVWSLSLADGPVRLRLCYQKIMQAEMTVHFSRKKADLELMEFLKSR